MLLPSLELNWLKKYDKSLSLPLVLFIEDMEYSGVYYEPQNREIIVDDKIYSVEKGVLLIKNSFEREDSDIASTIAHEWRHHWQRFNSTLYYDGKDLNDEIARKDAIIEYYTKSVCEMDAFLFESRAINSPSGEMVKEWLVKHYEIQNLVH